MRAGLVGVGALLSLCMTAAEASTVTWRFDFTSSRGSGFFEVDPTNFVIPLSAGQPTSFKVIAADINITDPGGLFGQVHYTIDNVFETNCAPGECRIVFSSTSVVIPNIAIYDHLKFQLNFEKIWIPWTTADQQKMQMWFHPDPPTLPLNWNAEGSVLRTVESVAPVPLGHSTWPMMILGLVGLGFMAYRRKSKSAAMAA